MKFIIVLILASFSLSAFAAIARCEGSHRGSRIIVHAQGNPANTRDGSGYISVAGRQVAQFDGDQLRVNYFTRTIRGANDQGDRIEGRLNNLRSGASTITRLQISAYGIDYRNISVVCRVR